MEKTLDMKRYLRNPWVGFLLIVLISVVIFYYNISKSQSVLADVGMLKGSGKLLIKNFTFYNIKVSGKLCAGFSENCKMAFIVPPFSIKEFSSPEGSPIKIGKKNTSLSMGFTRVDDQYIKQTINFDGLEGATKIEGIEVKRLWLNEQWVLQVEEAQIERKRYG